MAYRSFEELEVWKRGCQLAVTVYDALRDCKDYGLREQMQRAAVSIASNIAEGSERGGKDFLRCLRIAQGSCAELRTQAYIAKKIGLLNDTTFPHIISELKELARMLHGLRKALQLKTEH